MSIRTKILLFYLLIINVLSFLLMLADKQKARRHQWRIPEATLMTVAGLGGSLGGLLGMYTFRHKTRHPKFYLGIPAFLVLHLALFCGYLVWFC